MTSADMREGEVFKFQILEPVPEVINKAIMLDRMSEKLKMTKKNLLSEAKHIIKQQHEYVSLQQLGIQKIMTEDSQQKKSLIDSRLRKKSMQKHITHIENEQNLGYQKAKTNLKGGEPKREKQYIRPKTASQHHNQKRLMLAVNKQQRMAENANSTFIDQNKELLKDVSKLNL